MSLHTKYRPKTFDEVIGQQHIIGSLKKAVSERRARAYLFVGPSGTGKTTLARILANEVTDEVGTQANIYEANAADLTGVDDMRGIIQRVPYRAIGRSPNRVIILDEVHRLSSAAWQVLLKPLEEPPPHVFWCLCTTELGKIPKTILTRCVRYDLKPVDDLEIYDLLASVSEKEKLSVKEAILEVCAEEAQGSPRQALVNLEACGLVETSTEARRILRSAVSSPEVNDLCRWLVSARGRTWPDAVRMVKGAVGGSDAESIRIVVCNYIAGALGSATSDNEALRMLSILEAFSTPYPQSDKLAPLYLSVGQAIGIGQ